MDDIYCYKVIKKNAHTTDSINVYYSALLKMYIIKKKLKTIC